MAATLTSPLFETAKRKKEAYVLVSELKDFPFSISLQDVPNQLAVVILLTLNPLKETIVHGLK
jgi:hypothetical protein